MLAIDVISIRLIFHLIAIQTSPKLRPRGSLFWNEDLGKYCMPFPGSDRSVMMRTQRSRFHTDNERPAQARVSI